MDRIPEITTIETPTRYVAMANPRTIVIHAQPEHRGGFEYVCYRDLRPWAKDGSLLVGLSCDIVSYQDKGFLLECLYIEAENRAQRERVIERYSNMERALSQLRDWVADWQPHFDEAYGRSRRS
ncbi:MAG: hypothetical protein ACUVX1_14450 [Chloroflexota bacterium]